VSSDLATFEAIELTWLRELDDEQRDIYGDVGEYRRHLWQRLGSPPERCWVDACRRAVEIALKELDGARSKAMLANGLALDEIIDFDDRPERATMARTYLRCALAVVDALENGSCASETDVIVPDDRLHEIATEELSLGLLRDVARELAMGSPRPALRQQSITTVLVKRLPNGATEGVVATLTVELLADGKQEMYPAPEMALVPRDEEFQLSAETARGYLVGVPKLWEEGFDVRWTLRPRDLQEELTVLTGPSLGGAFTLVIGRLLAGD